MIEMEHVILGKLTFISLPKKALLSVHKAWRQERLISRITNICSVARDHRSWHRISESGVT
jgi:hypothetical protein